MRLFLDASVLLAAAGSPTGSSRALFHYAGAQGWTLVSSPYDRPILFTALAWTQVLLTVDKADFADVLGGTFYGLHVLLPYDFLGRERAAGRLHA